MIKRYKFIISIYLLYFRKNKVLLLRRYNTGYNDGNYSLPAGHLDEHETVTQGIAREVLEEIGIRSNPKDYELKIVMHRREKDERLDLFFINKKIKAEPVNTEPDRCDQLKWFPINKLPKNTIPYIRKAIENYKKSIYYSEVGWDNGSL